MRALCAVVQLAFRISAVMKFGAGTGEDPFAKVKCSVTDLIEKLQAEASPEKSQAEELKALADAMGGGLQINDLLARPTT